MGRSGPSWASREGAPFPLGLTWIEAEQAYNFALYSKHADGVTLLLYGPDDLVNPLRTYPLHYLVNKSARIWHCRVPRAVLANARYYAYAITGPAPSDPFAWHDFDPAKVLLDPYALSLYFPPTFDRRAAIGPGANAGKAVLSRLPEPGASFAWGADRRPRHEADLVIYELHVRGLTQHPSSGVAPAARGTYAGLIEKIPYLQELGITAVELMPVFQFDPQEGNYWGYMPLSFFAPHAEYARRGADPRDEFRAMVKALHAADIEVILDVVYNHTCEGDERGPRYSFKGIDNSTYYLLSGDPRRPYLDFSGTGNTFRAANRHARKVICDSLRYWVTEMHVDGFRFDLAAALTRNPDGSINWTEPPLFGEVGGDPDLAGVRLIVEPWDAAGAYQLGKGFPGALALQWNARFRDDVRRFLRGDPGMVPSLMYRLYGSDDLFPDNLVDAYHPYQSVNFLTSHDGFTLHDLLSYTERRNWANGHQNTDGPGEEYNWNCGWEGDAGVPAGVTALRERQAKNFCCLLFLSNGTPMLRAGDEFLQTQGGNSNAYNQDNETSWLDWTRRDTHRDVHRFFRRLIAFRKAHPSLARRRFWREDVRWYGDGAAVDMSADSHSLAFCLHGASQADMDLYVMINASAQDQPFTLQEGRPEDWRRAIDTSCASPEDACEPGAEAPVTSLRYEVKARSIVVLVRAAAPSTPAEP